jgi:hypothetical protein
VPCAPPLPLSHPARRGQRSLDDAIYHAACPAPKTRAPTRCFCFPLPLTPPCPSTSSPPETAPATNPPPAHTATHRLDLLTRVPSDLRRYIHWTIGIKAAYGTIPNYILQRRLRWTALDPTTSPPTFLVQNPSNPLANAADYTILPNDWPYGLAPGIAHLVVWLKGRLPVEPVEGRLTPAGTALVEAFVERVFAARLRRAGVLGPAEPRGARVTWFKNWNALQSVRALEHVHVLVRDVPAGVVREWTEGREPVQEEA